MSDEIESKNTTSTRLISPFDNLTTGEKALVTAGVSPKTKQRLFVLFLLRRGAQDKVIARFLYLLDAWVCRSPHILEMSHDFREAVMNELMNEMADFFEQTTPQVIATKLKQQEEHGTDI